MHVDPEVTINGIKLREYYCLQLYNALTPGHPNSLPFPEELPDSTYQFTCLRSFFYLPATTRR
jgi:hypothetical protein